jgi:hypothetical protein
MPTLAAVTPSAARATLSDPTPLGGDEKADDEF